MAGQEKFKEINQLLNEKLKEKKVLIAAHRGSWGGNIANNTIPAYITCLKMGADMFECDLMESLDGVIYAFHDGTEERNFGFNENLKRFYSEEIDRMELINCDQLLSGYHVERFEDILNYFNNGELFNIDRAWNILPSVARMLEQYPASIQQAVIKTPVDEAYLEFFENHPVKFMYMAIATSMEQVKQALSYKNINLVGVEIIANTEEDELFQDENIQWIREQGLFCWVNAIRLAGAKRWDLFAGLDDDRAIVGNPKESWGRIMDKGVEVIQTDWPAILSSFRNQYRMEEK